MSEPTWSMTSPGRRTAEPRDVGRPNPGTRRPLAPVSHSPPLHPLPTPADLGVAVVIMSLISGYRHHHDSKIGGSGKRREVRTVGHARSGADGGTRPAGVGSGARAAGG